MSSASIEPNALNARLVNTVTQVLQLLHPASGLFVRVIPCPDGAHGRWLVARVTLRRVVEV